MADPMSEQPPGGVPGLGNIQPQGFLQILQAMMAAKAAGAGPVGDPAGSPARPGQVIGPGLGIPALGLPAGIPGAGGGGGMVRGGVPGGSTGGASMPPLASQFVPQGVAPQLPYSSGRTTHPGQELIANSITAVANMVSQKREENQRTQFIEAENTWNQLLTAQAALQANPQDQSAKETIDSILSDKKRMKMVEESLHFMIPKEPGAPPEEPTPASHGAKSALGKYARGIFQTKTAAQQMPSGVQGPAPNTPGGYRWSFPQDSPMQAMQRQIESDPKLAATIVGRKEGLIPSAEAELRAETQKAQYEKQLEQLKRQTETAQERTASYKDLVKSEIDRNEAMASKYRKGGAGAGAGGGPTGRFGTDLTGQPFIDQLMKKDPTTARLAKAIGDYGMSATLFRSYAKNPANRGTLEAALQYNPNFSQIEYDNAQAALKSFTSGKDSVNIVQLNQAIAHLNAMNEAYKGLEHGEFRAYNWAKNHFKQQLVDPPNGPLDAFNVAQNAVDNELSVIFKNTAGTDQEIKAWKGSFSSSAGPQGMKSAVDEAIGLIQSRIKIINDKVQQAHIAPGRINVLYPDSIKILKQMSGEDYTPKPSGPFISPPGAQAAPMQESMPSASPPPSGDFNWGQFQEVKPNE